MENEKQAYQLEYEVFMKNYKRGTTDGEEVGYIITKMAQYFSGLNLTVGMTENFYVKQLNAISGGVDINNKPISAAKAKTEADATQGATEFRNAKIHLENVNCYLQSLKALQRGLMQEFVHMGNT